MPKSRLEAFADGIFAIAATLLILNVAVAAGPLGQQLLVIWPSYLAWLPPSCYHRLRGEVPPEP